MFVKHSFLQSVSFCASFLLAMQAQAGGVFYSGTGTPVAIPDGAEAVILLKKGNEITALDSQGNAVPSCEDCEAELDNIKLLVSVDKKGGLRVIGSSPAKPAVAANWADPAGVTTPKKDNAMQTVTEGIKLRKLTKQVKAHHGMMLTQTGDLVVMNVDKAEILKPIDPSKTPAQLAKEHKKEIVGLKQPEISDKEFAEIKRKFERTIDVKVTKGSVCIEFAGQPPGDLFRICSPPEPQWW